MGKSIDLTGQKIGKWTVLYKNGKDKHNNFLWHCRCECGTEADIAATTLKQRKSMQCKNCRSKKIAAARRVNIENERFGFLVALYPTEERSGASVKWMCKCDCGNMIAVSENSLKTGKTKSCGCIRKSFGELKIETLLKENNILFQKEFKFKELKFKEVNVDNSYARFDFAIFDKNQILLYLIEFDGRQHFEYGTSKKTWNNKENYEKTVQRDAIKNDWCKKNNIPLIRIPYTDIEKITIESLLLTGDNPYVL